MIPAAAYIRVSSEMQVDIGSSLPSQLSAIENYAKQNGYSILSNHIYRDEAQSARTADRPEFQRMISCAKKDKAPFQAIICYENSRFARSREDAIVYKSLLRKRGIKLLFVKQEFDDSPMGKLMEGIIEIVDEWYSANLAVETRRGQQQNAKDGYSTGGRPPYGMRRAEIQNEHGAPKAQWEPDPETAPVVKRIFNLYIGGMGYKAIANTLNQEGVPSPSGGAWIANTLFYILHNNQQAYLGVQIYGRMKSHNSTNRRETNKDNWVIKENAWEPIITQEMAKAASARATNHKYTRRLQENEETPKYLLTGKIFCGECGSAMVGSSAKTHLYYRCNRHTASGSSACTMPVVPVKDVEQTVVSAIKAHLGDAERLRKIYDDYKNSAYVQTDEDAKKEEELKASIDRKSQEKKRLIVAVAKGTIDDADAQTYLSQIKSDIMTLESQLSALQFNISSSFKLGSFEDFRNTVTFALSLQNSDQSLIDSFVERVDVFRERLHITFTIDPDDNNHQGSTPQMGSPSANNQTQNSLCRHGVKSLTPIYLSQLNLISWETQMETSFGGLLFYFRAYSNNCVTGKISVQIYNANLPP